MPWHRSVRSLRIAVGVVILGLLGTWWNLRASDNATDRRLDAIEEIVSNVAPVCYGLPGADQRGTVP